MSTITSPTAGAHFSQTVSANTITVNNGTYPLNTNTRWQWNLTGAESTSNAGSDLQLQAIADDGTTILSTPISIDRSSGIVTIVGATSELFGDGTVTVPTVANVTNSASGLYWTTNAVNVTANGIRAASFATATTGVNYLVFTPSATGADTSISVAGTDTNVGALINGKGTGSIFVGGSSATVYGLKVSTVASQAEGLILTPAAAGANAGIKAQAQNLILGSGAALTTSAIVGHIMVPTCAGTPTGAVTGNGAGACAMILDTTGSKIWFNVLGTWKSATVA